MAQLAGSSCSKKALVVVVAAALVLIISAAAASADGEVKKKKAPECRTVASCETGWCDGKCRAWGFTDPVGAYCTYGGTLTRCCFGSIGAAVNVSPGARRR